ncbi:MAG: N-acetyl-gamma-glutamyl-phosphate reductase [Planctomycetes bacterium]|nr:N-acetyl-gamma-glutamyl-phosphate reductase [Planctomycetota bacterium]
MVRVGILGATGYTALELIKILLRHPEARITRLTSRQEGQPHVASAHPQLVGRVDLRLDDAEPGALIEDCDFVFSCLPHGASASAVKPLVDAGVTVVDLSADYRLRDLATYEAWYGEHHADGGRLGQVPYGLPELFADRIRGASLVANPGCYPTSAILAITPLLAMGFAEPDDLIVDSKSGVSGAGRTPKLMTHYPECNESICAYNIGRHRHTPEIDQIVQLAAGHSVQVVFTPHLIPMDRGILTTVYATPRSDASEDRILAGFREFYHGKPFVRVVEHLPGTKDSAHTNFCDLTVRVARGRVIVVSCLDNLIKGASGAAVQNFNILQGFPETMALL